MSCKDPFCPMCRPTIDSIAPGPSAAGSANTGIFTLPTPTNATADRVPTQTFVFDAGTALRRAGIRANPVTAVLVDVYNAIEDTSLERTPLMVAICTLVELEVADRMLAGTLPIPEPDYDS